MTAEVSIIQEGTENPRIIVSAERVKAWLRQLADEAGYADRETCMFQLNVERPFYADTYHHEAPSLLIMVSNIPDSRPLETAQALDPETLPRFTGIAG